MLSIMKLGESLLKAEIFFFPIPLNKAIVLDPNFFPACMSSGESPTTIESFGFIFKIAADFFINQT